MRIFIINYKYKILCVLVLLFLVLSSICYGEIIVFNDNVMGIANEETIRLVTTISSDNSENLKPDKIDIYFDNCKYSAAVIYYPYSKSNFSRITKVLDTLYHDSEQKWIGSENKYWRIDKRKFAVFLSHDISSCPDNSNEQYILVTYKMYKSDKRKK